jgi:transcription antitermination protein
MIDLFNDIKIFKMPHLSGRELEKKSRGEEYKIKYVNIYKGYIFLNMVMTDEA